MTWNPFNQSFERYPYLKQKRLGEVISLISVLAVYEKHSFRTEDGLRSALNGKPASADKWLDIARGHPEFFKLNSEENSVVLLLRFLQHPKKNQSGVREILSISQAQKIIDQAIALHDKQLARYQRNSFKIPIYAAVIAAVVSLIVATVNTKTESETKASVEALSDRVDSLNADIKTSNLELVKAIDAIGINESIETPEADSLQ